MQDKVYLIDNKELMAEWDYELNSSLNPEKLLPGSNKKAWWKCSYCGNKWQTQIYNRTKKGSGCTKCYSHKRSSPS